MKQIILPLLVFCTFFNINSYAFRPLTNIEGLLSASDNFLNALSPQQKSNAIVEYKQTNAIKWTNLPCGLACRVGILFSSLSTHQQELAREVARAALGSNSGSGYEQVIGIMKADAALGKSKDGYSSDNYIIAFLGAPSATGKWQLQIGGHHLAVNLTFNNGIVTGITPLFMGLEPPEDPTLKFNHDAMIELLTSLSPNQCFIAKLDKGFNDVYLGPGKDGEFPVVKLGIKGSLLSKKQKSLLIVAMRNWIQIADNETFKSILKAYVRQLDDTYVSYFGNISLNKKGDYVRIDGPGVWIEFVCQPGAVYPQGIHYHTVYRDHVNDYGNSFSF
ncbi:hypothetical protein ACVWYN_003180 [Pedobacter sp. UYP24]